MTKLGLVDQMFFKMEQAGMTPLYMGGAMVVDPTNSPYPMDAKSVAIHIAACMEAIPLFRKKLVQDKMRVGTMRLVDDKDFNVNEHVIVKKLKAPGGFKELTEYLGQFSSRRLDLSRPLWHYEIIDGLQGGQIAIASHIHHCLMDGIGASKAFSSMWSLEPSQPKKPQKESWQFEQEPSSFTLIKDAVLENAKRFYVQAPMFALKSSKPLLTEVAQLFRGVFDSDTKSGKSKSGRLEVRRTSLNVGPLSSKRIVTSVEFPMSEIKALRKEFNCSINDLALTLGSYALQHYFESIGEVIDFDLVAGMPINVRADGDEFAGNMISGARINLHNLIRSAKDRLEAIQLDATEIKKTKKPKPIAESAKDIDGQALMGLVPPVLLDVLFTLAVKTNLMDKLTIGNVAITNVPGNPVATYLGGAKIVTIIPLGPLIDGIGLTILITSSPQNLIVGFHGCGEAIKDKELLVEGAIQGFLALKKASMIGQKEAVKNTPAQKPAGRQKAGSTMQASKSSAAKKSSTEPRSGKRPTSRKRAAAKRAPKKSPRTGL